MLLDIEEPNPPINPDRISRFEAQVELTLPSDYRDFLLKWNGGRPVPPGFPIAGFPDNPMGVIQAFFGLDAIISTEDLTEIVQELRSLIPPGIIPIACTGNDDFLCIDARDFGCQIKFWDRKSFWGNEKWNESDLYPVAASFASLLAILCEF